MSMTVLVPMTVTNRGPGDLTVQGGEGGDKIVKTQETADTHSPAAVLDMIDEVKAEVQAKIGTGQGG